MTLLSPIYIMTILLRNGLFFIIIVVSLYNSILL